MSTRWCGTPRCSSIGTLSVPMSMPRYTAVESHATISPPRRLARARPSALLPVAVGPTIARSWGEQFKIHDSWPSALLDPFVVKERDGEGIDRITRIHVGQAHRRVRELQRGQGGAVERIDARGPDN